MGSLTSSFLEELAETINALNHESNSNFFNPSIAILSALLLTGSASFSSGFKTPLLILCLSLLIMLLARSRIYSWLKIVAITALWAITVSTPLIFTSPGSLANIALGPVELRISLEGFYLMATFTVRVVAAAAVFTAFIFILGWRRMVDGLRGLKMPEVATSLISLSIIYIPYLIREMVKMLSAREVRIVRKTGFRELWYVLASVVGDLMLRSYEHAWRLEKAIKARSINPNSPKAGGCRVWINDLILLILTFCITMLGFLSG
jgi:energy-coupling factor transporter transmembrane protein EcfT